MNITISSASRGRVKIECDSPAFCDVVDLDSEAKRKSVAKRLSIDPDWFIGKQPGVYEYSVAEIATPLTVTVRDMYSHDGEVVESGDPGQVVGAALSLTSTPFLNPVVEWDGTGLVCVLDIDYHHIPDTERPNSPRLSFIMSRVQPQPALWFESRNGGIHAIYTSNTGIPADVLAAVASFSYRTIEPLATFEIISRSRLPTKPINLGTPTTDLSAIRRFLTGGIDESSVDTWLHDRGLAKGEKRDHSHCPIHPEVTSHGEPVYFGDNGVRCFKCEANGILFGSRFPGFFPYASVIGSHSITDVALMVRNFTHFTHAEVVLDAKCRLKGKYARLAYEGMLRLVHGDDERIPRCFAVGRHLLRGVNKWVTPTRYETISDCRSTLASLPACQDRHRKPVPERLDLLDSPVDLTNYGYVGIKPLHGCRVFGEYLGSETSVSIVLPPVCLPQSLRPKYGSCLTISEAWDRVEEVFPGIDRNYLLLLLAARGVAEAESGMPCNIMCIGPAASGKSSIPLLAASILGDGCTEAPWVRDEDRFRQKYMTACDKGMFVVVNEVFKCAKKSRVSPREAMDSFLNITPGSVSHAMYIGAVPLGRLPVTIATDTYVPPDVRSDIQLGRRFIYVRLTSRQDWEERFIQNHLGQDCNFRSLGPDQAEASNAILTHVIDRWFRDRLRPLTEIAEELGFSTLEHSDEIVEDPDAIPRLYREVCDAPEHIDSRHTGKGWRKVGMEDETELRAAWEAVCDGLHTYAAFSHSRKCSETDLSTLLPVPIGTILDCAKASNRSVVIRFRYGSTRGRGDYSVNKELETCEGQRR